MAQFFPLCLSGTSQNLKAPFTVRYPLCGHGLGTGLMGEKSNIVDLTRGYTPLEPPEILDKRSAAAKSRAARRRAKKERQIEKDEQRIDADLNRAIDAIALLAQNNVDPIALIHRISPMEEEEIASNIEKSLEWLLRFANQWRSYVQNRIVQTENIAAGNDGQARSGRLHLVRRGD